MMRQTLLAATLALLPGAGFACEYLTHHFELCSEGTSWAAGVWENGGDSATLHLGEISFDGYEEFRGHDKTTSLRGALTFLLRDTASNRTRQNHIRDKFTTAHLKIERSVDTDQYKDREPMTSVLMIAQAPDKSRLLLGVRAPASTPVTKIDRLSREFAALVRPRQGN